ncbi:hypothetical protein C5Y93_15105 [Blastopirellula marina]|uniref:Uncharacterized protein n=1 Tax=Blastopirellula marina TaxID=124 RepID=A0A2S8GLH5_9BACT|nr:hypothetical protein C5Y93_15105 [Blastopirellula marina]
MLLAVAAVSSSPCLAQEETPEEAPSELMTFAHLSYFSDRGLMTGMSAYGRSAYGFDAPASGQAKTLIEKFGDAPAELRELLQPREANLLDSPLDIDWLDRMAEAEPDVPETLARLSCFGLIELFRHQNSRLLDTPLVTRKEMMDKLGECVEPMKICYAGLIGHGLTRNQEIVLTGQMRRLSVDFDLIVLASLSPKERARVNQLIKVALPVTIQQVRQDNQKFGPFAFSTK